MFSKFTLFQKAASVFDIVRHYNMQQTWVGVRDVAGNDAHVSVGSGTVLDDNSNLWYSSNPSHGIYDCVYSYGHDDPPLLKDHQCTITTTCHICERY